MLDLIIAIFFLIHLVMKTTLFKLLSQAIIPHYATNYNIKFQTRLKSPLLNKNSFYPFDLTKRVMRSIPFSICSSEHAKDKRT
ncbi:hypothetical protein ECC45_07210 [Helicobacter pylori]|nr:hypothetical protein ECC45_07210 [Helicobacter pylori]